MATPQQYVINKLTQHDKAWPEFLDAAILKHLQTTACRKELTTLYTDIKNAIERHLTTNLAQIIKDTRKSISDTTTSTTTNNIAKPAASISTNIMVPPDVNNLGKSPLLKEIIDVLQLSRHTKLLSETLEEIFVRGKDADLPALLEEFAVPRFIATIIAGYLTLAIQDNILPSGIEAYGKLYTDAVIRIIVEKQLGANSPLTDYKKLIKYLAKTQLGKNKVLPSLIAALIKSAQLGNPYTRAVGLSNESSLNTIKPSKAFTNPGLLCAVFMPHEDFLRHIKTKDSARFSAFTCFSFRRESSLTQHLQLEANHPSSIATFFNTVLANYNGTATQSNDSVKPVLINKTTTQLSAPIQHSKQTPLQDAIFVAAKHDDQLYLHSSNSIKQNDIPDLASQNIRTRIVAQKTTPVAVNRSNTGAYPKGAKITKRGSRSYKQARDIQLLRHIATQLYGFCRTNKIDPVEIQLMYYDNSLYISTNMLDAAKLIVLTLSNIQALKKALVTPYSCGNESKIKISRRHANKIRTRVYKEFDFGNESANIIKSLLNNNQLKIIQLDISKLSDGKHFFNHEPNTLYIVVKRAQGMGRHAEEDLMDLLEAIYRKDNGQLSGKAIIYGKRRPCFSCYSRLDSLQTEDEPYVKFNPNPGLFFERAFFGQSTVAAMETFSRLSTVSKIYESRDDTGYNTLSDSENESSGAARQQLRPQINTKQNKWTASADYKEVYAFMAKESTKAARKALQITTSITKPLLYMSEQSMRAQKELWQLAVNAGKEEFVRGLQQLARPCSLDGTMRRW